MQSRTKVEVERAALARAVGTCLEEAVEPDALDVLADGSYNAAYALRRRGGSLAVVKVAPPDDVPVLTYERHLMAAEIDFYTRASGRIPAPTVLGSDTSRRVIDRDLLVMSRIEGRPLSQANRSLSRRERAEVRRALGSAVAGLRGAIGTRFGYDRPDGALSATTWSAAFSLMVHAVLTDADRFGVRLGRPASRLTDLVRAAAAELDVVAEPILVHFDLWDGNVFVATGLEGPRFAGVIDGERAFWGDPLAELASTSLFRNPRTATDFTAGYAAVAGTQPDFSEGGRLRLSLYKAYLDLVMLTEDAPRGYRGLEHAAVRTLARSDLARQVRTITRIIG